MVGPPVPPSAGITPLTMPDDKTTRRSAAQLAHLFGPIPINVIGAATTTAQPYVPPPIAPAASVPTGTTQENPSPTPSVETARLVIATTASSIPTTATPTQHLSATRPLPAIPVVTATTTIAVPLVTAKPATTTRPKPGTGRSSSAQRTTHSRRPRKRVRKVRSALRRYMN